MLSVSISWDGKSGGLIGVAGALFSEDPQFVKMTYLQFSSAARAIVEGELEENILNRLHALVPCGDRAEVCACHTGQADRSLFQEDEARLEQDIRRLRARGGMLGSTVADKLLGKWVPAFAMRLQDASSHAM